MITLSTAQFGFLVFGYGVSIGIGIHILYCSITKEMW